MVSSTLCPAVHILGSQNVYGRAEGIADHYWPWAVFLYVVNTLTKSKLMKIRKIQTESKLQEIDKKVTESYRK